MILFLNVSKSGDFIKIVFEEKANFFQAVVTLLKKLEKRDQNYFYSILNNIFLDDYKILYFKKNTSEKDKSLEDIFINSQIYFSNFYNDSTGKYGINDIKMEKII